ncbi:MAG: undecaprenyl/decaprenyl-phosphate alpha-N-acetylglucosaminyl 1-phosphate transferase, partial [Verrucomicrobia bacterium]|nr:undecaprenyl/decaprenyl-phosphate alpha-N-acetylglucosaminyl 1-phosphate transferase [Verrucomicrobiota bacterium]
WIIARLTFRFWVKIGSLWELVDKPGYRKIHHEPTSLAGGLTAMAASCVMFGGLLSFKNGSEPVDMQSLPFFISASLTGGIAFFILGLVDDVKQLKAGRKFLSQLVLILLICCWLNFPLFEQTWMNILVTALWFGVVLNALNFLDNMNGLCCGLGIVLLFGFWGLCLFSKTLHPASFHLLTVLPICVGGLLGFLPFNYPKAEAFLGNSGSHWVGYWVALSSVAAGRGLMLTAEGSGHSAWTRLLPVILILLVPLYDFISVMIIRLKNGKPVYIGDTNHISHRLVKGGWPQPKAVALIWGLTAAALIVAWRMAFVMTNTEIFH